MNVRFDDVRDQEPARYRIIEIFLDVATRVNHRGPSRVQIPDEIRSVR
jgi:hypothetical protein